MARSAPQPLREDQMSLVGTLAKVAIGIAAAKGIGHVMS